MSYWSTLQIWKLLCLLSGKLCNPPSSQIVTNFGQQDSADNELCKHKQAHIKIEHRHTQNDSDREARWWGTRIVAEITTNICVYSVLVLRKSVQTDAAEAAGPVSLLISILWKLATLLWNFFFFSISTVTCHWSSAICWTPSRRAHNMNSKRTVLIEVIRLKSDCRKCHEGIR